MPDIIVVDDESDIRRMLKEYLELSGFQVRTAAHGRELRAMLEAAVPDLVVLDVAMPGEDGFTLARFVRERYDRGIIMLTAADSLVDRVVGLEVGADDYLAKPFEPKELLARIRAVLRRRQAPFANTASANTPFANTPSANTPANVSETVPVGRFRFSVAGRTLIAADGSEQPLPPAQAELLAVLITHAGKVLSRERLLELAPARGEEALDRSIDHRIQRLRQKIEDDPGKPEIIKTIRGGGYLFSNKRR